MWERFDYQHHSMLIDLCDEPLIRERIENAKLHPARDERDLILANDSIMQESLAGPGKKKAGKHHAVRCAS
jgi:hypothetical protein